LWLDLNFLGEVTSDGRLLQVFAAATGKARSLIGLVKRRVKLT